MPVYFNFKNSLFDSSATVLINPVNCVGVMGKGLALSFRQMFPKNYRAYCLACKNKTFKPGTVLHFYENGIHIINFPTKRHWRNHSRIDDIKTGLEATRDFVNSRLDLAEAMIAMPKIGCGNGGLDWEVVGVLVHEILHDLPNRINVYGETPQKILQKRPYDTCNERYL